MADNTSNNDTTCDKVKQPLTQWHLYAFDLPPALSPMLGTCAQPGNCWCHVSYHQNCSCWDNICNLGIWSNIIWQLCLGWFLGCCCCSPYTCNQGIFNSPTLWTYGLIFIIDLMFRSMHQVFSISPMQYRHQNSTLNSIAQQCSLGYSWWHVRMVLPSLSGNTYFIPNQHYWQC